MNEDTRKNNPSELEIQNSELNEEQLDEATGGMDLNVSVLNPYNRRCAANPSHFYYAQNSYDVCPFCGAKEFIELGNV